MALKGGAWLAGLTAVSQVVSWLVTILVARILSPEDYGLMDMATIFTGYFQIFYQLGIGAAIIQRQKVTTDELSSLFWSLVLWGSLLACGCFILAYPTVWVYDEPRVFYITQSVAILFILGAAKIVPQNVLHREFKFKAFGFITALSVIVACIVMYIMALSGAGVWTLIGGHIVREVIQVVLLFLFTKWRPTFHFSWKEVSPYLRFGLPLTGSASLTYAYSKADIFFGGRAFAAESLGQYSFAHRLAEIPNNKILSLINQVSYPVFSRYQFDAEEFQNFFLKLLRMTAVLVLPLYAGGMYLATPLITLFLGEKWLPAVLPFQLLCVHYLIGCLCASAFVALTAKGKPQWGFYFNLIATPIMIGAFALAVRWDNIVYLTIPWAVVFVFLRGGFFYVAVREIGLTLANVGRVVVSPMIGTAVLTFVLLLFDTFYGQATNVGQMWLKLLCSLSLGGASYLLYMLQFERPLLSSIWRMLRERQ